MFQVEPTVVDERRYTSGRSERHQKTSPTLPEGSPVPDDDNGSSVMKQSVGTPLALMPSEEKAPSRINPKFDKALQNMWQGAKDNDATKVTLVLHIAQYTKELLTQLKALASLKVIAIHVKQNEILVRVPLSLVPKLAEFKEILQITLSTK